MSARGLCSKSAMASPSSRGDSDGCGKRQLRAFAMPFEVPFEPRMYESVARMLLEDELDADGICAERMSYLLFKAATCGHESLVRMLLENGVDVNMAPKQKSTPLFGAATLGHASVVQMLLSNGADVNKMAPVELSKSRESDPSIHFHRSYTLTPTGYMYWCDKEKSTPLFGAVSNGHAAVVQMLIGAGADMNTVHGPRTLYLTRFSREKLSDVSTRNCCFETLIIFAPIPLYTRADCSSCSVKKNNMINSFSIYK